MNMFGKITEMLGANKMAPLIAQGFGMFDKDNSGFIEGPEVKACLEKVLSMAGLTSIPDSAINSVFARVAGPDQKLDKAEFTALVNQLLSKVQTQQAATA